MFARRSIPQRSIYRRAKASLARDLPNVSNISPAVVWNSLGGRQEQIGGTPELVSLVSLNTEKFLPRKTQPHLIGVGASTWARSPVKLVHAPCPNGLYALERADHFLHPEELLQLDEEAAIRSGAISLQNGGPADTAQWRAVRRECLAVSENCGLLDFSSLSRFVVEGPGASDMLQRLCANTVAGPDVPLNALKYTMRTDADGRVEGSLTILKMGEEKYLLMCYAITSLSDWLFMKENLPAGVSLRDVTKDHALFVVTGPQTDAVLQPLMSGDDWESVANLRNFMAIPVKVFGQTTYVSRVSYCGGLGYELHLPTGNGAAAILYEQLRRSSAAKVTEFGYMAAQVMRTEAGRPCFTVDIPAGARYLDCVPKFLAKLGDHQPDFRGKSAINTGGSAKQILVHLAAKDPNFFISTLNLEAPPVGGKHRVLLDGHDVGYVTSGFYGFRAGRAVMFALLDKRPDLGLTGKKMLSQAEPGRIRISGEDGKEATAAIVVKNAEAIIAC